MTAEALLAQLWEELLKTAQGVEQTIRSIAKALFLVSRLIVGKGIRHFFMFWFYSPKLIKKVSPTRVEEVDNGYQRLKGVHWGGHPNYWD